MVKALVVYVHPVPDSFVAAMRSTIVEALDASGHSVDLADLYADGFDPLITAREMQQHALTVADRPFVSEWSNRLRACDTLILVYPTWWSAQPAMLKGWFERVWVNGVAFDDRERAHTVVPLLRNINRVIAVTCHGSTRLVNAANGEVGKRFVKRALRLAVGRHCRIEWLALYGMDHADQSDRERFLERLTTRFAKMR